MIIPVERGLVLEEAHFTSCASVFEEEVRKIIMSPSSKISILDPIHTHILKSCLPVLLPIITRFINLCFGSATVPVCFKMAVVIPLLKKIFLDPEG